jgi:predicted ATPase/DNA-binding SARP family transcriptional activator
MRVGLLGPLTIESDEGAPVPPPGATKERAVLELLGVRIGSAVSVSDLIDALWGENPPRSAAKTIQTYVSSLRHRLSAGAIETLAGGYRLSVGPEDVDVRVFERLLSAGSVALERRDPAQAVASLREGLALWRGEPLHDVADQLAGRAEITRLHELRLVAEEKLADARLGLGEHEVLVGDLEAAVATEPLRERRWAQLMLALYRAGRQPEALRAFQRLRLILADELGLEPSAESRALESAILAQDPGLDWDDGGQPSESTTRVTPSPLADGQSSSAVVAVAPTKGKMREETSLFGRIDLLDSVAELVRTARLVTLCGPGGVGKTSVATRTLGVAESSFPDGALFIELASAETSGTVADLILTACRSQTTGTESTLDGVVRILRPASLLLVIDNCEHLITDVHSTVTRIIADCPKVHLLLTSREPLAASGEHQVPVPPLDLPTKNASFAEIAQSPAVQLFSARAANADPSFSLSQDNAAPVGELCRLLDGLPFAIELAASRLDVESLDDLTDERRSGSLINRLENRRAKNERHASVAASLDWSYEALSPGDQNMLKRLSVFVGPFTREMAIALVGPADDDTHRALDRLIRGSLISRDLGAASRWRLLDPTKAFCRLRLTPLEWAGLRQRHATLMLLRAEMTAPLIRTADQVRGNRTFMEDLPDHRAAMSFFLETADDESPSDQAASLDQAARLLVALFAFCQFNIVAEANRWAIEITDLLPDDHPTLPDICGAAALGAWYEGRTDLALQYGERAVERSTYLGQRVPYWARLALVDAYGFVGRVDLAMPSFSALVADSRADPDPFWQINGLGYEAIGLMLVGRLDRAAQPAEEAIRLARQLGNPECLQWALHILGRVATHTDPELALELFEEALAVAAAVDSRLGRILNLSEWVAAKRRVQAIDDAAGGLLELYALTRATGIRSMLAAILTESAFLLHELGDDEAAAVALAARTGLPDMPGPDVDDLERLDRELHDALGARWERLAINGRTWTDEKVLATCAAALSQTGQRRSRTG